MDSVSLHHLSHDGKFDKSSTIPRNSDLGLQFRKFSQSQRPTSTVSLLAEPELAGRSAHQLPPNTATIRRKPSSKPAYRRGTISGGVPIPISTPQIPRGVPGGGGGSDDNLFLAPSAGGTGLGYSKRCTSTQSLSALASSSSSPYYQLIPGQMPIPVPVPTVPPQPPQPVDDGAGKQQLMGSRSNHLQLQYQQQPAGYHQINHKHQHSLKEEARLPQQHFQIPQPQQNQYQLQNQQHKQKLFQQQQQQRAQLQASASVGDSCSSSTVGLGASPQPQAPSPSGGSPEPQSQSGVGLLSQIRSIKLRRTITDDRSAPLLPSPSAPK